MTTVTSSTIVYNRSGVIVIDVTANGTTQVGAGTISRASGVTVAVVTVDGSNGNKAVILPSDAEIGDVVEVYNATDATHTMFVFADSGSTIGFSAANSFVTLLISGIFRKTATSAWQYTGA
jgi:hypothetical protein